MMVQETKIASRPEPVRATAPAAPSAAGNGGVRVASRGVGTPTFWLSKTLHRLSRVRRQAVLFLAVLGPGVITMVADNDAGGISTYAVTGAQYGFNLLWVLVLLLPIAYFTQEM